MIAAEVGQLAESGLYDSSQQRFTAVCALHRCLLRVFSSATMSAVAGGPKTATPPADTARGATADLADVFIPEPVDQVSQRKVEIMEPIFQLSEQRICDRCCGLD